MTTVVQVFAALIASTTLEAMNERNDTAAALKVAEGLQYIDSITYCDFVLHTVPAPFAFTSELAVGEDMVRTT